jgi:hypothetical protein
MITRHDRQTRQTLAEQFAAFAGNECRLSESPFYAALCERIAADRDLLDIAAHVRIGQRAPNLFLAAVQYLVLTRDKNPLRAVYGGLANGAAAPEDFFPTFRRFCLDNGEQIAGIVSRRTVQTNEVRRSALFLPALFLVEERADFRPFHFIDVGCSAGFNLLWDRYHYRYSNGVCCGDASSALHIPCELRGQAFPPLRAQLPKTASRVGIEIEPVDVTDPDTVVWLRSLIWPDQHERMVLFDVAMSILENDPPRIVGGDCAEKIPEIVGEIPASDSICLLFSHSVNQAFSEGRRGLSALLEGLSSSRRLFEISLGNFEEPAPELILSEYENGRRKSEGRLATCHPHGNWIRWNR